MAIMDQKGKIHGKIGNYIHRELNGKQVLQSASKPRKPKGGTIEMNKRFREAAELSGVIYVDVKDFAWDRSYSYLHGRLTGAIKRLFFSDNKEQTIGKYLALDKDNSLQYLFPELPIASKRENRLEIDIPEVTPIKTDKKLANAQFLSYEISLMGFADNNKGGFRIFQALKTERFELGKGYQKEYLDIHLEEAMNFRKGLLLVMVRTELFQFQTSSAFLNSKECNPAGILGMWQLG